MRAGIAKIVQNLAKMLHETIVDYYVKNVNSPLYKGKGRILLRPQFCWILTKLFFKAS
jgi:hypothetical protein